MMRLNRLNLTRYGHFTDAALDFGDAPATGPDLHVVYGPNEAGKSTVMTAWLDLLYGFPTQTPMDFKHSYDLLRVGARLTLDGAAVDLSRVKRKSDTLRGPDDRPVDDGPLLAALGGVDRASHNAMFSLDDRTLEEGGDAILHSEGELGRLLFAATAGLAEQGRALERLARQAEVFHKPRAQTTDLKVLKDRLTALTAQRAALDMRADEHRSLHKAKLAADTALTAAQAAHGLAAAEAGTLRMRRDALAALPRLRADRAARAALPDMAPPPDWAATHARLTREALLLTERRDTAAIALADLDATLAGLALDPRALAQADRADALAALRQRLTVAQTTAPASRAALDAASGAVADLLRRLGREGAEDPLALAPDLPATATLRKLLTERSGLVVARDKAAADEAEARRALAEAPDPGPAGPDPGADAVRRWQTEAPRADAAVESAAATLALAEAARARDDAALAALRPLQADDASGAMLRATRERAWAAHRLALSAATADDFEAALRRDDLAVEARLGGAAERARLLALTEAASRADADRATAAATHVRETAARDALGARIAAALGRDPVAGPAAPLAQAARAAQDAATSRAARVTERAALASALATAEAALRDAVANDAAWAARWAEACAGWALADPAPPDPDAAAEMLDTLAALVPPARERVRLKAELDAVARDEQAAETTLAALAQTLGSPADAVVIARRVADARAAEATRITTEADRTAKARELATARQALAEHEREAAAFLIATGADTLEQAGARCRDAVRRAELDDRIVEAEAALALKLGAADAAAAEAALADADAPALDAALAAQDAAVEDALAGVNAAAGQAALAAQALGALGGDGAAARLDAERAAILAEIEAGARLWLSRSIGVAAVRGALARYRDTHRSAMMRAAGEAFATITGGRYPTLIADADNRLIAMDAGGASKLSNTLSKGTRFQLYLALRVAAYRDLAARRTPPPFWADDILETFDDARTAATLRVLADMARVGQVICLTHHAHVVEIARATVPGVRVQTLA